MVLTTTISLPQSVEFRVGSSSRSKPGARTETDLVLDDETLQDIVNQVRVAANVDAPLRFASLMEAKPTTDASQEFHVDSTDDSRVNAIVYLTDVLDVSQGPVEMASQGPVLGPRGTAVIYKATDMHRGVANHSEKRRLALAMAFAPSEDSIRTIGQVEVGMNGWGWAAAAAASLAVLYVAFGGRR